MICKRSARPDDIGRVGARLGRHLSPRAAVAGRLAAASESINALAPCRPMSISINYGSEVIWEWTGSAFHRPAAQTAARLVDVLCHRITHSRQSSTIDHSVVVRVSLATCLSTHAATCVSAACKDSADKHDLEPLINGGCSHWPRSASMPYLSVPLLPCAWGGVSGGHRMPLTATRQHWPVWF